MLAVACGGASWKFAPPRGEAPLVSGAAWEGTVRAELPYPRPVGPDRMLLVMGHDLAPMPWTPNPACKAERLASSTWPSEACSVPS